MTYRQICRTLEQGGVESPEYDARLLLEHFCGVDHLALLSHPQADYTDPVLLRAIDARASHTPLQYLLGEWPFYRQTYEVTPDCLIPRSDTEILVEAAVELLPRNAFFADLCTGSGCIAISTLAERPDTRALALELSEPALALARRNALRNGVSDRLVLQKADVLTLGVQDLGAYPRPNALLSNPPYIRTEVLSTLSEEVRREPRMALDGGADGLLFYRALISLAADWLAPDGICLFEIGFDQGAALCDLAEAAGFSCTVRKDYGGCDRVTVLRRKCIH